MWPKPSQLIWTSNSECIRGLEIRMNDKESLGFILPLLVVANSAQGWHANQGIFLLRDYVSPEYYSSLTSSSFLPLETWYNFIFWLPCGWMEPCGQLWPMNWGRSEECSFRTESLIGRVVAPSKESTCQCRRYRFISWVEKIRWRRKRQSTRVFLPGESHGRGARQATVHGVAKSQAWLRNRAHIHTTH